MSPRHRVVNRRDADPLGRHSLSVSEEAVGQLRSIAKALAVSQGSLVDTAIRHLADHDPEEILELLAAHGHLTDTERQAVQQHRQEADQ